MAECGIFGPEERWELIDGVIYETVGSIPRPYYAAIHRVREILRKVYAGDYSVFSRSPLTLDEYCEPEADIVVAQGEYIEYSLRHPTAFDTCLVMEIYDGFVPRDRVIRAAMFAKANIAEYWILDLVTRQLEVCRNPTPQSGYSTVITFAEEQSITPVSIEREISVASLLLPL
ncbi:hypothetical protein CCAX7_33550 [Capsulimonas corticalis]|uniref:Uncharacterized protein n=2 Tax=Capsulimonas corticalis TaxID=2219043 RepID=A0A402CYN5_9BACT|nr:hypothetical protein CCAX7_33550 [Capsulimonas corticalis]